MTAKLLTLFGVVLLLAAMPTALANNGDGDVVNFKPDVVSVGESVTLEIQFRNDATDGSCLDEIIITAPGSWGGTPTVTSYDRGSITQSSSTSPPSVTINPDHPLCPGETVNIVVEGFVAPSNYEVSVISIQTSDMTHSGAAEIDDAPADRTVYVTHATKLKLEYFHIADFSASGFEGQAWGAWARLETLSFNADSATPMSITVDTNDGPFEIYSGTPSVGLNTISLNYGSWVPLVNDDTDIKSGYIRDGTTRAYTISYAGSLTLKGSSDSILPDEKLTASGLAGAKGTIITAGGAEERKILVQLTDDANLDVNEVIPLQAATDLGTIISITGYKTDTNGNSYFTLDPECDKGLAHVVISTDPLATVPSVTEVVGINSGPAYSYAVTKGDGAEVPVLESQEIEVTVYDECGNVITNTDKVWVYFDYLGYCADINRLAQSPGVGNDDHEQEQTNMGDASIYLVADCELCAHQVNIEVQGIGGEVIDLETVEGPPAQMQVTIIENDGDEDGDITADWCIDALIEVTDVCGNRIVEIIDQGGQVQEWESIVGVYIDKPLEVNQPGWASSSVTHITGSDFREGENFGSYLLGKLNNGAGTVEICGCQGLGDFDVVAESDTLDPGSDSIHVINAAPDCIETTITDGCEEINQLLQCEPDAEIHVAIKDICGNYMTDQNCGNGDVMDCVELSLTGGESEYGCEPGDAHLSTEVVCIDVGEDGPGYLETPVTLFRDTDDCCVLELLAAETASCCDTTWGLEQCEVNEFWLHGGPAEMTTRFESVNPANQWLVDQYKQIVSEEVRDVFEVWDACGHIVKDFNGDVDVELIGEDCVSYIEVDSSIVCEEIEEFHEGGVVLDKIVIDNCADPTKRWTDLEEEDIVVDKLAFDVAIPPQAAAPLYLDIYAETEVAPGFNPANDHYLTTITVSGAGRYVAELPDYPGIFGWHFNPEWPFRGLFWDDQRDGGWLIEGGDSQDFYVVLSVNSPIWCMPGDVYDVDFAYYQDFNSPDITDFQYGGQIRDGFKDGDDHAWTYPDARNDDYGTSGDYAYDYGFGDRVLYNLKFQNGIAYFDFRDLVDEHVIVRMSDVTVAGSYCKYDDVVPVPQDEEIDFISQPATQVVMINHDLEEQKIADCGDEIAPLTNGFHINLQTADGFQNDHAKEVEVELDYCLKWPFGDMDIEAAINGFCMYHPWSDLCEPCYMDTDRCFTREDYKEFLADTEFGEYWGDVLFGDFFGSEFSEWVDAFFENAEVVYFDDSGVELPYNSRGKQVVMTDVNGQAEVYATSPTAGLYKLKATPLALDADFTFASFVPGPAAKLDIMALPAFGIPADGEEEAMLLLRALDACGNAVWEPVEDVTVTADGEQVFISQDFNYNNNYDNEVEGTLYSCGFFGNAALRVLSDLPQTSTITASALSSLGEEGDDSTSIAFQGAPVQLKIVEITPSDRLPADGQTGAWVTVQVQDRNGNRVTGYLGDGFSGDPGDPWGFTDFTFESICVSLSDDMNAFIPLFGPFHPNSLMYGWTNFHPVGMGTYCGDLMFGQGRFYVVYGNQDCNHGGNVDVSVFDVPDYQGQEVNENGLPLSVHATQLDPDMAGIEFVDPATQWNIWSDKQLVLADGKSKATISVQVENDYMDVRQAVEGNVYVGGTAESGAIISWNGESDDLNPASMRIVTDPITGEAVLELTSTEPGIAEVTIVGGDAYICQGLEGWSESDCMSHSMSSCSYSEFGHEVWFANGGIFCMGHCDISEPVQTCMTTECTVDVELDELELDVDCAIECGATQSQIDCFVGCGYSEFGMACWDVYGFEWCTERAFEHCSSADFGLYTCPGCDKFIQQWNCHYSSREDLTPKTIEVEFLEVADNELYLEAGWNFVSVPYELEDDTVADVFADVLGDLQAVYAWDANAQNWDLLGGSDTIAPLEGYWVKMDAPGVISLVYDEPAFPSIPTKTVKAGWNAVGLTWDSPMTVQNALISIQSVWSQLIGWVASVQGYDLPVANVDGNGPMEAGGANMQPKQGYWIWVTDDAPMAGIAALGG